MKHAAVPDPIELSHLWANYRTSKSPALKTRLLQAHRSLVQYAASSISRNYGGESVVTDADLLQLGFMGLLDAIERFDPTLNVRFETYALTRIRGAIQDGLRAADWMPRSERKANRVNEQMMHKIDQQRGGRLSDVEVAEKLELSMEEYEALITHQGGQTMITADFNDQDSDVMAAVPASKSEDPYEQTITQELKVKLFDLLQELPERERLVVTLYYYEGLAFKEIGKILQISESRVFQIHKEVLEQFRHELADYR